VASPTSRTLDYLRSSGYVAGVVETWLPRIERRRDLFGFIDIVGVHPVRKEVVFVQTTTTTNLASRIAKAKARAELAAILAAGARVLFIGWGQGAEGWAAKIVELTAVDLEPVTIVAPRRRIRGADRWQPAPLF
jgi:hypothetical protein